MKELNERFAETVASVVRETLDGIEGVDNWGVLAIKASLEKTLGDAPNFVTCEVGDLVVTVQRKAGVTPAVAIHLLRSALNAWLEARSNGNYQEAMDATEAALGGYDYQTRERKELEEVVAERNRLRRTVKDLLAYCEPLPPGPTYMGWVAEADAILSTGDAATVEMTTACLRVKELVKEVERSHRAYMAAEAKKASAFDAIVMASIPLEALYASEMNGETLCRELKKAIAEAVMAIRGVAQEGT